MTDKNARRFLHCVRSLLLALALLAVSAATSAAVFVSVAIAPPVLPVYAQPICPGPNYIWIPGYWAYGPEGYYWVPGTWVIAPYVGALWTPGWWGWANGLYVWNAGYWGPHVGFYGGINYGFGYFGVGYQGGYWNNGAFYYNRTVNNVNVTRINTTYNTTIVNNNINATRVAYNGGTGGINARPTVEEETFAREAHRAPTQAQLTHERAASTNRAMLASVNQGRPSITTTPRPGAFARAETMNSGAGAHNRQTQNLQVQGAPGGAQGARGERRTNVHAQSQTMQGQPPSPHGQGQGMPPQGQPHMQGGQPHEPQGQAHEGHGEPHEPRSEGHH
ncbi:MAG TPA: hypothetical protein VMU79_13810 [Casimicrobiaceae bacterium]|nr:hypothetical protein [Casimicrobiaceae bacterium]